MSMNPLVVKLKEALDAVGLVTGSTQDAVIISAIAYVRTRTIPEAAWNPIPVILDPEPYPEPEMPIDVQPAPAKPKAKPKAKKVSK